MNSKKICIIGTHGCGKSTLSYALGFYFKRKDRNVCVINETVRSNPFGINENYNEKGALWCVHKHILRELEAEAQKAEIIISDRSPIDNIIYGKYKNLNCKLWEYDLPNTATKWMNSYACIVWVTDPVDLIMDDGVRSQDEEFRNSVHELFNTFFKTYNKPNVLKIEQCRIFEDVVKVCEEIDSFSHKNYINSLYS